MENADLTQATQGVVDPRRMGRNNSGLSEADRSDVICILHPCSPAAFQVVASTAQRKPENVLQRGALAGDDLSMTPSMLEEQETFILSPDAPNHAMDLAFRFSAMPIDLTMGFVFGRSEKQCDVVLVNDTYKRVSNLHFRIFFKDTGVLMLEDTSTNGTMVDTILLKRGKNLNANETRMLGSGSIIEILSTNKDECLKFVVRIPPRNGFEAEYDRRFQEYMQRVEEARQYKKQQEGGPVGPSGHSSTNHIKAPLLYNPWGMHWSGGDKYNVVGLVGKGAFATVYQLATKNDGILYAAKELDKRKFMKNGVLDQKLHNELQIMRSISHPNVVQYIDYHDHASHLYIVMEYVPCGDLQQYLSANGVLPETLGRKMADQVLTALSYLHGKRITHRDIKPDNILLADQDPERFTIKLSDFGLSKVVTNNETFLKTFCGTLLYCAPEVFPHYDAHVAGRGQKRPRKGAPQASRYHSYSQSVDIWSFGAVLWFTLCNKPPFEGVADPTGRGMFDKIMKTPLDSTDLIEQGVSDNAVALLAEMLNTDPASRPTPADCLKHTWFTGSGAQAFTGASESGLRSIAEEDDDFHTGEPDVASLSLDERNEGSGESQYDEASIHSGSMNFFDPRQSKRFKSDVYAYREVEDMVDSSPEFLQATPLIRQANGSMKAPNLRAEPMQPKLFGEVSESYIAALTAQNHEPQSNENEQQATEGAAEEDGSQVQASPSLLGAESLLRDVHMADSHHEHDSASPQPKTPDATIVLAEQTSGHADGVDDITPKPVQKPFSRRIDIPRRASFFYDPLRPETHNLEYASKISGHDFRSSPSMIVRQEDVSLPTTNGSTTEDDQDAQRHDTDVEHEHEHDLDLDEQVASNQPRFVKPPPRMGRLVSTPESFASITINLTQKTTSWGRMKDNDVVYADGRDVRVPKIGIIVEFDVAGMDRSMDMSDLTKVPELYASIATQAHNGISINGVHLSPISAGQSPWGKLYHGDEIVVLAPNRGHAGLVFNCEFYHGKSKSARPAGKKFAVLTASKEQLSTPASAETSKEQQPFSRMINIETSRSSGKENAVEGKANGTKKSVG